MTSTVVFIQNLSCVLFCSPLPGSGRYSTDDTENSGTEKHGNEDDDEDSEWNGDDKPSPVGEAPPRIGGENVTKNRLNDDGRLVFSL